MDNIIQADPTTLEFLQSTEFDDVSASPAVPAAPPPPPEERAATPITSIPAPPPPAPPPLLPWTPPLPAAPALPASPERAASDASSPAQAPQPPSPQMQPPVVLAAMVSLFFGSLQGVGVPVASCAIGCFSLSVSYVALSPHCDSVLFVC